MADAGTVGRIAGLLKPTFAEGVKEQQQLIPDLRKRVGKPSAGAWKAPGQYYEISARVSGNRGGISPAASDDPLPTANRQKEVFWQIYDRGYLGKIQMYEKDMLNTNKGSFQAFLDHKTDEVKGITRDFLKCVNIDLSAGDGSGVLSLVNANTTASATIALQLGTGTFQYGSLYLAANDVIDIYDTTLTTSRTAGTGVTVQTINPSVAGAPPTIVVSTALTLTAGDVVIRGKNGPNKAYIGPLGMLRNQGTTFQNLSTTTYPILASNRINMAGQPLTETVFQNLEDIVMRTSGEDIDEYWTGLAQFAAYKTSGFSQKRFTGMALDKGFTTLSYDGKKLVKGIDIPSAVVMALNTETIKFGTIDEWGPSTMDESFLKVVPGFAAYYAYFREDGQMIYERPNASALADGLSFDLTNLAYAR